MTSLPKAKLIRLDDHGVNVDGEREEIVIDSITHLGRSGESTAHTERISLEMLKGSKFSIKIDDPSHSISRNHAMIYPPGDLWKNEFTIRDLRSFTGTYLDGLRLGTEIQPLINGSRLQLSKTVEFEFRKVPEDERFNHALMVGHSGGNLKGTSHDVVDLEKALDTRGFRGKMDTLFEHDAYGGKILRKIELIKKKTPSDSIFLFYFAGHGNKKGELSLSTKNWNETLTPFQLFQALKGFRGQIVLILDGCYTTAMTNQVMPPRTAIIGTEGKAYERESPSAIGISFKTDSPTDCLVRGSMTRAIIKALQKSPNSIRVHELLEEITQDPRIKFRQEVTALGTISIAI